MNRVFLSVVKTVAMTAFAISSIAHAAEEKKAVLPDSAKGETLYTNGDAARGLPACVSCHGAAGASTIAQNPKLAGQHEAYLYKQLLNFKGPDRKNAIMTAYASAMTDDDMKNVAAYLDKQPVKPGAAKSKDTVETGKRIYRAGIAEKNVSNDVYVFLAFEIRALLQRETTLFCVISKMIVIDKRQLCGERETTVRRNKAYAKARNRVVPSLRARGYIRWSELPADEGTSAESLQPVLLRSYPASRHR